MRRIPVELKRLWLRFLFFFIFSWPTWFTFLCAQQIALLWKDAPENPNRGQEPKARKPKAPKEPKAPKAKAKPRAKKAKKVDAEDEEEEVDNSDPVEASNDDEEWLHMSVFRIHSYFLWGIVIVQQALCLPSAWLFAFLRCLLVAPKRTSCDSYSYFLVLCSDCSYYPLSYPRPTVPSLCWLYICS
jgi:hypothetical protein